jgi:hypothetical protein
MKNATLRIAYCGAGGIMPATASSRTLFFNTLPTALFGSDA